MEELNLQELEEEEDINNILENKKLIQIEINNEKTLENELKHEEIKKMIEEERKNIKEDDEEDEEINSFL